MTKTALLRGLVGISALATFGLTLLNSDIALLPLGVLVGMWTVLMIDLFGK